MVEAPSFETAKTKGRTLKIPNIFELYPPPAILFIASQEAQPFAITVQSEIFLVPGKCYVRGSARNSYKIDVLALASSKPDFDQIDEEARICFCKVI